MTQAAILAASGSPGTTTGFKNRIINGACVINQRNTTYTLQGWGIDMWSANSNNSGYANWAQNLNSITPPPGFTNYLGLQSNQTRTFSGSDYANIDPRIEGYNIADWAWGSSSAKTITISFWTRGSITGTYSFAMSNAALDRTYRTTYTISSANTWEYKTITVPGCTDSTWNTTNGVGVYFWFGMGVGTTYAGAANNAWNNDFLFNSSGCVNVCGTNGATWYITGLQCEVGTTATNFDYRSVTTELQLCQRYLYAIKGSDVQTSGYYAVVATGWTNSTGNGTFAYGNLPVTMRTQPSVITDGTASHYSWYTPSGLYTCTSVPVVNSGNNTPTVFGIAYSISGATASQPGTGLLNGNSTYYIYLSAEM